VAVREGRVSADREAGLDANDLNSEIAKITWYHSIPLGNGIVTHGVDDTPRRLRKIHLPGDLAGKTVLDVGAWDGFFSFEAARRGAARVLATDSFSWTGEGWGTKAGFDLARRALGSNVEDKEIDVLDLSPDTVGVFDVVLFLGILYHMKDPMLALERVFSVTGERLIMSTLVDMTWRRRPAMAFYPGSEANDDPTNWWGPNPAAVQAMLRSVGFSRVEVVDPPTPLWRRPRRSLFGSLRHGEPFFGKLWQGAIVCHAWR
jgi:tRNA (mo5U34)-methyltransferase